jgi:hypothetical protein
MATPERVYSPDCCETLEQLLDSAGGGDRYPADQPPGCRAEAAERLIEAAELSSSKSGEPIPLYAVLLGMDGRGGAWLSELSRWGHHTA